MQIEGVEKAKIQWGEADLALHQVKIALRFDVMHREWRQFLIAANAVQNIIEKAAATSPQDRQWWATIKRNRRTDPLLNYMFQARHSAEHGYDDLLAPGPNLRGLPRQPDCTHIFTSDHSEHGAFSMVEKRRRRVSPPDAMLLRVYNDKWEKHFDPPTSHLGKPLRRLTPLKAGSLWLAYLKHLIAAAEARVRPQPPASPEIPLRRPRLGARRTSAP